MIYIITGPTASGKTEFSEKLAQRLEADIISADSLSVYRYADIGTAKPVTMRQRYHLVDIKEPDEDYTAHDFVKDAGDIIAKRQKAGKDVVISGGTVLYLDSLINGLPEIKVISPETKAKIAGFYKEKGLEYLLKMLEHKDPELYREIDRKNPRRVIRALEVIEETGCKFSDIRKNREGLRYDYRIYPLSLEKELLRERVKERTQSMLEKGLVNEAKFLFEKYGSAIKIFSGIGYREVLDYLRGLTGLDEMKAQIIKNTMAYAKRQRTFIKKLKNLTEIEIETYENFPESIINCIKM